MIDWLEQSMMFLPTEKIRAEGERVVEEFAEDPGQLLILDRYLRDVERAIAKKQRQLELTRVRQDAVSWKTAKLSVTKQCLAPRPNL